MAVGSAKGEDAARVAAEQAISSQLLDITIDGARGILFNVTGGPDLSLFHVNQAAAIIKETAHPEVNLIFGAVIDPGMKDAVRITVIATGFESTAMPARRIQETNVRDGRERDHHQANPTSAAKPQNPSTSQLQFRVNRFGIILEALRREWSTRKISMSRAFCGTG